MLEFTRNASVVASIDNFGNLLVNWEIAKQKFPFSDEQIKVGDFLFSIRDKHYKTKSLNPINYYIDSINSFMQTDAKSSAFKS